LERIIANFNFLYIILTMKTNQTNILKSLIDFGLSERESKIYFYLLKNFESTVFNISKNVNIPRTTTYSILRTLENKQLAAHTKKNNVIYYEATSTNRLFDILKEKQNILENIIPNIKSLIIQEKDTPDVKLFLGIEGVKAVYNDALEIMKKENIKQIYSTSELEASEQLHLPTFFKKWLEERQKFGIKNKMIIPFNPNLKDYIQENEWREIKYIPTKYLFNCTSMIYSNKIALFSLTKEPYCMVLESKEIVKMFKQLFLFAWDHLTEKDKLL
jgi:sugar-specific transcriptional regulator TrmB